MSRSLKVGIFIVGGVALFCVGIFLIGSQTQFFGSHFTAYAEFNNVNTLSSGSAVRVGGMSAGQIAGISVPKSPYGKFRLKLEIDKKFLPIVRRNSVATIETEGMVGNEFVNVAKGTANSPECAPGCTLPSQESTSMEALMREGGKLAQSLQATITDIHHRTDKVMDKVNSAAGNADDMLAAMKPSVVGISKNANAIVSGIRQGHGAAGKLLTDKTVEAQVTNTVANAAQATANLKQTSGKIDTMVSTIQKSDLPPVHQTIENAQQATAKVNKAAGTILAKGKKGNESTAQAIHDTIHQAQQTTVNLADDTAAIKRNFFFRGFFKRRGYYDLSTLSPSKYAHTRFVRSPTERVWIPAAELFATEAEGSVQLTDTGHAAIDEAMAKLVPYLPNNPVVVEGYASSGPEAEEYLQSRERALAVSQYVQSHFHLKPDMVGIMPLGNQPPPHTGKQHWDGICLVLVQWKK